MNNNGFSYVELLMSLTLLVILSLALTEFATNTLDVADSHTRQVEKAMGTRLASERITELISKASYIFPANTNFTLSSTQYESESKTDQDELIAETTTHQINTDDSIAILVPSRNVNVDNPDYKLYVFYLAEGSNGNKDLYEYSANDYQQWVTGTLPAATFNESSGTSTLLAKDVNPNLSNLTYTLSNIDSTYDSSLLSGKSIADTSNANALISGASWDLTIASQGTISCSIKGVSKNVPRYLQPSQYDN